MVEKILEEGDHEEEFQRDFVITSHILIELSLEERDVRTDGFQQQYIEQLMGKAIDLVDYQKIIHKSEIRLQTKLTQAQENQAHTEPSASTHSSPPALGQPCPECGIERRSPIDGPNDSINSTNDDYFFIILKLLMDVNQIPVYNGQLSLEERDAKTDGFQQ
ncbi:hypothetical protein Cgig2_028152 [Carnegiea gigantea]|uniref:Uncharacterized protein n=1 Tax=Carnegiea gigantea TaxID=171969 RepID=A0A9Q1JZ78_9CARY|nr:hypothetical protein Cgig2_028152 [Carnegiea gigantea]